MDLTFATDFTNTVDLDSQLVGTSDSGLNWNRGVIHILTINNLLAYLPVISFTFEDWAIGTTYSEFDTTRSKSDIVTFESIIYQSLVSSNVGNQPDENATEWLPTNIDSLRIKSFIWTVEDNFRSALTLDRQLIENQYIYNVGETAQTLPNDFAAWVFEPKGSDYVKIRINQIALQANTTDPVSLFVINQGQLIDTLTLNPNNGILSFENVGYTISGKGRFILAIESQDVLSDSAYNDPLKYDGFVCYPMTGTGDTPEDATYSETFSSNGMNFNISAYLDSSVYLTNNSVDFAQFQKVQMELDFIRMVLHNSNTRANRDSRNLINNQLTQQLLSTESLNLDLDTIAAKYQREKKLAAEAVNKTFDRFLVKKETAFIVNTTTI